MTDKKEKKELTLQPIDTKKPDHPCWNCGMNDWWQRKDGGYTCGTCHPQPNE